MPIDRSEVTHAHLFEDKTVPVTAAAVTFSGLITRPQGYVGQSPFESFLGLMREFQRDFAFGQTANKPLKILRQLVIRRMLNELVQVAGDRTHIFRDAPFVVIE